MDLVDRDRRAPGVGRAPEGAMRVVAPVVDELGRHHRGGRGPELRRAREGVGLERQGLPSGPMISYL